MSQRRTSRAVEQRPAGTVTRRLLLVSVLASASAVGACGGSDSDPTVALVPAGTPLLQDRGPFELAVQMCESDLIVLLGSGTEVERYRMPADTIWESVTDFYDSHIGSGWLLDTTVPPQGVYCRRRAWRRDGLFSSRRFTVALLDDAVNGGREDATPFRALVVAAKT